MNKASITDATQILGELLNGLEDGYWEASTIEMKDLFYDLISAINMEITELSKLSIQDHHLEFEPVTLVFRRSAKHLADLHVSLHERVARAATADRLDHLLTECQKLFPK